MGKQTLTKQQQLLVHRIEEALAYAKKNLSKTKAQVAEDCKVTAQALNNWLRRGTISKQSLVLLAEATQVNPHWLYTGLGKFTSPISQVQEADSAQYEATIDKQTLKQAIEHVLELFLVEDPNKNQSEELAKYITAYYSKLKNNDNILDSLAELHKDK